MAFLLPLVLAPALLLIAGMPAAAQDRGAAQAQRSGENPRGGTARPSRTPPAPAQGTGTVGQAPRAAMLPTEQGYPRLQFESGNIWSEVQGWTRSTPAGGNLAPRQGTAAAPAQEGGPPSPPSRRRRASPPATDPAAATAPAAVAANRTPTGERPGDAGASASPVAPAVASPVRPQKKRSSSDGAPPASEAEARPRVAGTKPARPAQAPEAPGAGAGR